MNTRHVLIVDDEADIRELLVLTLMRMGVETDTAQNCDEAIAKLASRNYDLCLTDMRLPDGDGLRVLSHIGEHYPHTPVAVITAYGSTENAVAALKAGAFDYLSKPIQVKQLRTLITSALSLPKPSGAANLRKPNSAESGNATGHDEVHLLGESAPILRAREMIARLARSQAPVYITGESGTGKEVAARLIHAGSVRRDAPFIAVNCGAIPENLMESEFFGYRKGAFTGADTEKEGYLHAAAGGTLFLDEVGDLPLAMQVKLLRVIQEKKVRKLGDTTEHLIDFRIISATHRNLALRVAAGEFRQDLFYRLNVIELKMPSLREIPEDIPAMVKNALERLARQNGIPVPTIDAGALRALQHHDYPGNVRELENIIERAVALCDGQIIGEADLYLAKDRDAGTSFVTGVRTVSLQDYLDQIEREQIMKAMEQTRYNKTAAAKVLGISFRSLRYRLDRLGIE